MFFFLQLVLIWLSFFHYYLILELVSQRSPYSPPWACSWDSLV